MGKYEKHAPARPSFDPIVNTTVLARLMGVTMETLRQWRMDGLPVEGKTGKAVRFDLRKVIAWRIERVSNAAIPDDAKGRKMIAEAERIEMQNAESRGELVRRDAVEREAREDAERIKQAIMNVPPRLAQPLASETNSALVEAALARALTEALQSISDEPIDEEEAA